MSGYYVGGRARAKFTFRNLTLPSKPLADPEEATAKIQTPAGAQSSEAYEGGTGKVKKTATGEYYIDIDLTAAGVWIVKGVGSGEAEDAIVCASPDTSIEVESTVFLS